MDYLSKAKEVLEIEAQGIAAIQDRLDDAFIAAAELILASQKKKGKLVIAGVGKNWHISNKLSATFNSTGSRAAVLHPIEAMHGDFGILEPEDVLLAMSYSGASDEVIALLPPVKRRSIPIIGFTAEPESPLALHSDVVVSIAVPQEACPFNMAPTASTTATLALGDALAMVLLEAHSFKLEDYALRHPGGAIGRTLLLHVKDIMRTGEKLARIHASAPVRDALIAMTSAKSGSVAILDASDKLVGILTDGDLRRHLLETPDLLDLPVEKIMSANPLTLHPDMLAVEVLTLYETHPVDDLIVVDENRQVVGTVDIQDMPKLKVL